ncbi:DNA repair protein RecO [Patescibacteria group bacterium]
MHHIYKTKGIILADFDRGESNKVYYILTQDFGMLAVYAQGVRELKSKSNYSLQTGMLSDIDMVRGKEMWRVTSAQYNDDLLKRGDKKTIDFAVRIFALVRRLTHGEERNEILFNTVLHFLDLLKKEKFSDQQLVAFEIILNLRILHALGYGTDKKELEPFLNCNINTQTLFLFEQHKRLAVGEVNGALKESHL